MIYKILLINIDGLAIYARIEDDGKCYLTCAEDHPEFKEWVEAGNTPLPAEE